MSSPSDPDGDELERAFDEDFAAWDAGDEDASSQPSPTEEGQDKTLRKECGNPEEPRHTVSQPVNVNIAHRIGPSSLLALPREMLLRILSLVPATGLTSCACTCTTLSALASDDALWRRLYWARWGKPNGSSRGNTQWKRTYLDADTEEWEATRNRGAFGGGSGGSSSSAASGSDSGTGFGGGDDPALAAIFLDMLRAKRDTAPDRRLLDSPLQADPGDIAAKVAAWRRSRGFPDGSGSGPGGSRQPSQPPPRPDLSRRGRASLTFARINPGEQPPVYACEQNGWVHVCGDACTEGVVDARSELLVCPVSGQTTDRLVHECEEEEGEGARCGGGGAGGGEEEVGLGVFAGGFGSLFVAGYECENDMAFNKLLGYKAL